MPVYEIPVESVAARAALSPGASLAYSQVTDLGGSDFEIDLRWNRRAEFWALSIRTAAGADVALGVVLAPGVPLLRRVVGEGRPAGEIFCTSDGALVGRDELGGNALLLYVDGEELDELLGAIP